MGDSFAVISAFAVLNSASVGIGLIFNQYQVNSMIQGNNFCKAMRYLDSEKHMLSLKESDLLVTAGSFSKHKPE